jgi:hypothetical protein
VVDKIVSANAHQKSAAQAAKMLWKLADLTVSVPQIMTLSTVIGHELQAHLQEQAEQHSAGKLAPVAKEPPRVVAVAVDGGRIMTRAEAGRGVHDQAWKETKNGGLVTLRSTVREEDPHPELPTCFADRSHVEQLVREIHSGPAGGPEPAAERPPVSALVPPAAPGAVATAAASTTIIAAPATATAATATAATATAATATAGTVPPARAATAGCVPEDWKPKRLVRTCLSSMVSSAAFGPLLAGEAQRRGFYEAAQRAFLGDGLPWNWTLHATFFPDFVPILDFVHPLGYLYAAAQVLAPADPWPVYLRAATAVWQGRVGEILDALRAWQADHPPPPDTALPDDDPRAIIRRTVTYLDHNQARMDYPTYRRQGLPVSSSLIESLIKEINYRVKGTEKFWNRPDGAEAILQVRAAALCDDDRLSRWILERPGSYFYRPSTATEAPLATAA